MLCGTDQGGRLCTLLMYEGAIVESVCIRLSVPHELRLRCGQPTNSCRSMNDELRARSGSRTLMMLHGSDVVSMGIVKASLPSVLLSETPYGRASTPVL